MRPRFRSDLQCSREEQQGVVFYRVDDPKSQTSFRLYEIEYLIAQKLDGRRTLPEVIKAVKDEYNFDISEPDLQKFVSQLDSMGFVEKEGGGAGAPVEKETQVMDRSQVAVEGEPAEIVSEAELIEQPAAPVDEAELRRLLKSALLHVRQGYIVHARDYFLAAKELNPSDSRLAKLVSHLEIIGDSSGPAEVDYLWNQAQELFPEIAAEVGPLAEAKGGIGGAAPDNAAAREPSRGDDDLRKRILLLALVVLLVAGGGGALYWFATTTHIFEGAAKAAVATLKAQRVPIFQEKPAESVRAAKEQWLVFASGGKVADVAVGPGVRVQAEQVLVSLALPASQDKQLAAAKTAVKKSQEELEKVAQKLEKIVKERDTAEAERALAEKSMSGASKKDLEKWKKAKAKATKKIAQLTKKEKAPRKDEAAAKKKAEAARKKLEALEQQAGQKQIHAPFAGLVVDVPVKKGAAVEKDQKALLLRNNLEARLSFLVTDAGGLAPGGEAFVSVARGKPSAAKVSAVQDAEGGKRIEVNLVDPVGSFVDMPPQEFRLVREFIDRAFEVPAQAVVSDSHGTRVLVEVAGKALAREVEVLSKNAATAVIRDKSGTLRDGERVVVDRVGAEGGVASIVDGSNLDVQQSN